MEDFAAYFRGWEEKIGAFLELADGFPAARPAAGSRQETGGGASVDTYFAVKDNIAVKGMKLTCASKLLSEFVSPYTATAVKRLLAAGGLVAGKTNLDEFGMGSSTDLSGLQRTNNPYDVSRVPGGSSGGSAAAVSAGLVPYALGSDTGGSVRQPAAFCGVAGLKPTWGAVSRFGLVSYASSLETIGVLADSIARCRAVFHTIRGYDEADQTTRAWRGEWGGSLLTPPKTIGVLKPEALEPETQAGFEAAKRTLRDLGYTLVDVEVPTLKYVGAAYYTIATAEASANLARFDGVRYGKRPENAENPGELVEGTREAGFGDEVKLRILLGTFVLRSGFQDQFYNRAQEVRSEIRRDFERYVGTQGNAGECAALLLPVFPTRAFGRGEDSLSPFAQKAADLYTCAANLAGLPSLAFPASLEGGLPVGVQLLGRAFCEDTLFDIAAKYEAAKPFPHPSGWRQWW